MRDIGTAGFSGFIGQHTREIAYHPGGHGAGLAPSNHSRLVAYVLDGVDEEPLDLADQPGWFRQASNLAPYATGVAALTAIGMVIWLVATGAWTFSHLAVLLAVLVATYILLDIV
jgi:hypothetical protein